MMLRYSLLLLFISLSSTVFAQLFCPPVQGKRSDGNFHISAGGGLTYLYGDIDKSNTAGRAGFLRFDLSVIRGIDLGIEGQFGTLEALGDVTDVREVKNNYRAAGVVATIYPFKLFSAPHHGRQTLGEILGESFYAGVGFLGIVNNYTSIYRDPMLPYTWGPIAYMDPDDGPLFNTRTSSTALPTANVGFAIPINKRRSAMSRYWSVLLNAQFNFANNDYLDGYMPHDRAGVPLDTTNDMYTYYSLGLRYSL